MLSTPRSLRLWVSLAFAFLTLFSQAQDTPAFSFRIAYLHPATDSAHAADRSTYI